MTQTEIFRPKDENKAEDFAEAAAACSSVDKETCSVGTVATLGAVCGLLGCFWLQNFKKNYSPAFFLK
jgi:hypothetical protein